MKTTTTTVPPVEPTVTEEAPEVAAINVAELEAKSIDELQTIARDFGITNAARLKKPDLINRILQVQVERQGGVLVRVCCKSLRRGMGFCAVSAIFQARMISTFRRHRFDALVCELVTG